MKALIVITKNYHENPWAYEQPDVYTVEADGVEDVKEHTKDILEQMFQSYLDVEEKESSIPICHMHTYCSRQAGYEQIVWENGDIHQYHLVIDPTDAEALLEEYRRYQGEEEEEADKDAQADPGYCGAPYEADRRTPRDGHGNAPMKGGVLALSTVHVHPDSVDFLSVPMNSDALQVFPNSDQCVMHVMDAKAACKYDIAPSVKDCIRYADKQGCSWIYFGYYGDEDEHLPTYRTAWDMLV